MFKSVTDDEPCRHLPMFSIHENIELVHTMLLNNHVPIEEVVPHMYISHGCAHEVIHNRLNFK